jgi:hypothetical protein
MPPVSIPLLRCNERERGCYLNRSRWSILNHLLVILWCHDRQERLLGTHELESAPVVGAEVRWRLRAATSWTGVETLYIVHFVSSKRDMNVPESAV